MKTGYWFVYENRPRPSSRYELWSCPVGDRCCILGKLIDAHSDHDWTMLYEPYSTKPADPDNKEASCSGKAPVSENKPDHLGEVYTEKEYCILGHGVDRTLSKLVIEAMEEGWKPLGGIAVEHLSKSDGYVTDSSFFYQAMVRGV